MEMEKAIALSYAKNSVNNTSNNAKNNENKINWCHAQIRVYVSIKENSIINKYVMFSSSNISQIDNVLKIHKYYSLI